MPLPGRREWIFSIKMFAACMMALATAFVLDLPHPSWSMLTIFIVAQPLAGMLQSKALYRLAGTVAGSVAAVFIIVAFAGSPELQTLALATWLGWCVYVTVIHRTPSGYVVMLAGYTASFIAFPSVDAPDAIFATALARVEEIALGILCAVVVDMAIFPQRVGPMLQDRLDAWLADAVRWTVDMLTGHSDDAKASADRRRLIVDAGALENLRVHAQYDTPELRNARSGVHRLQHRIHTLLSLLVSIRERIATLREARPAMLDDLRPVLHAIAARVEAGDRTDEGTDVELLRALEEHRPSPAAIREDRCALLCASVVARLEDLVRIWAELRDLRARVARGERDPEKHAPVARHRDHRMAALSGLAAAVAVVLSTAFWIVTGWPHGSGAVMMAAVTCSLFSSMDDPTPAASQFRTMTLVGLALSTFYVLAVLPGIAGFPLLVVAMAAALIPLGAYLAMPAFMPMVLPLMLLTVVMLGLQNDQTLDFEDFINSAIAQVVGIGFAGGVLRLMRALGRDWTVQRTTQAVRRDLARLAGGDPLLDRHRFEGRMFDRLNGLFVRLGGGAVSTPITHALAGLRVGLNILRLRSLATRLPPDALQVQDAVLEALSRHFRGQDGPDSLASMALRGRLDDAIARLSAAEATPATTDALLALAGIRHALFRHVDVFDVDPVPVPEAARIAG